MDVIIQLIIFLIIIISVLKRVKEVSRKGQELDSTEGKTGQKPSPANQQEMSAGEYSEPDVITSELSEEPYEPVETPEIVEENIFETQPEPLIHQEEIIKEPVLLIQKPVVSRPAQKVHREASEGLDLGFTAPQVINGIIMGEILGPPVSMRHDERVA